MAEKKPKVDIKPDDDPLWDLARSGNVDAQNELVKFHLPLVYQVVGTMIRKFPDHTRAEDLNSYGLLGLLKAIKSYDPSKASFRTHAASRIRFAIIDELRVQDHVPYSVRQKLKKMKAFKEDYIKQYNREPDDEELAESVDFTLEEYKKFNLMLLTVESHDVVEDGSTFESSEYEDSLDIETRTSVLIIQEKFVTWLS